MMIELEKDLQVIGEAENGRQAVAAARKLKPDLVLMDIAMPVLNGLEAMRQVLKILPATKVLILSAHNDDTYVKNAIESGAAGYLLKQTSSHDVCHAIRKVFEGGSYFSPIVSKRLEHLQTPALGSSNESGGRAARLTSRETEVLQLVAEGRGNKAIAAELGIAMKTVEKHREHLMTKLDIHDAAGLTRYAIGAGIIESSAPLTIA